MFDSGKNNKQHNHRQCAAALARKLFTPLSIAWMQVHFQNMYNTTKSPFPSLLYAFRPSGASGSMDVDEDAFT